MHSGMVPRRELQQKTKLMDKMANLVAKGIKSGIKVGASVLNGQGVSNVGLSFGVGIGGGGSNHYNGRQDNFGGDGMQSNMG